MPINKEKNLSFGRYLQCCRLEKKIQLETLAVYLRISTDILNTIENEDFEKMPEQVYVKGFLRSFAEAVGADVGLVLQKYTDSLALLDKARQAEHALVRENQRFWQKLGLSALVMLAVVALPLIFFLAQGLTPDQSPAVAHPKASAAGPTSAQKDAANKASAKKGAAETAPAVKAGPPESAANPAQVVVQKDKIRLAIKAVEETWIKIIVDNQKPKEYTLKPGDRLELEADQGFNVLIGNATGVNLTANGQPVHILGEHGQVVNIEIP